MTSRKVTLDLRCRLTPDEWRKLAEASADAFNRLEESKGEAKEVASQYKATQDKLSATIKEASLKIASGFETRPVECEEVIDYERGRVTTTRLDTFEVVSERPLTNAERQRGLDLQIDEERAGQEALDPTAI